jgi:DNA-binding transcriptional ArsR family regulator
MDVPSMYGKARHSVILRLFGKSPEARLIDLFLDNPLFEFTRNEMIESLGMAKVTLFRVLPGLEDAGLIDETRKIGKASLYRLNGESPVVKSLRDTIRAYIRETYKQGLGDEKTSQGIILDERRLIHD